MSSRPALLDPADLARQRAGDAEYYREVLHKLIAMGTDLAGAIHRQATAQPGVSPEQGQVQGQAQGQAPAAASVPDLAIAFDRVARTVRRTIMLARKLSEPDRAPAPKDHAGRRPLGGHTGKRPHCGEAEQLTPEFLDRLDTPDLEEFDDLDGQPLDSFIAGLRRDLARAVPPGAPIWKPRTSQDVWNLCVRAAQLTATEPQAAPSASGSPSPAPSKDTSTGTGPPAS